MDVHKSTLRNRCTQKPDGNYHTYIKFVIYGFWTNQTKIFKSEKTNFRKH